MPSNIDDRDNLARRTPPPGRPGLWARITQANARSLAPTLAVTLPLLFMLITLVAAWSWVDAYSHAEPSPIAVAIVADQADGGGAMDIDQALQSLSLTPATLNAPTLLSQRAFWFITQASAQQVQEWGTHKSLFLQVRRATETSCWDAQTRRMIGTATETQTTDSLRRVMAGISPQSPPGQPGAATPPSLLCRATFEGPGQVLASAWNTEDLRTANTHWHRQRALIDGGLGMFAVLLVAMGLLRNNRLYLLLATWIVLNLRVAELSLDMDHLWFGYLVPSAWLTPMRVLTLALYGGVTLLLFLDLFNLAEVKNKAAQFASKLQILIWPMIGLALVVPVHQFVPVLWGVGALLFATLAVAVTTAFIRKPTVALFGYGLVMILAISSSFYEILRTALNWQHAFPLINASTAAMAAGLAATVVVIERFRAEQQRVTRSEAAMKHAYNSLPLGLFTLDNAGRFLNANPQFLKTIDKPDITDLKWADVFGEDGWEYVQSMLAQTPGIEVEFDADMSSDGNRQADAIRTFLLQATKSDERIEGSVRDVTVRQRALVKLQYLSEHDPLTGLLNRNGTEQAYALAIQNATPVSVAFIDIDRFNIVNVLYGDKVGDQLLRLVAGRMTKAIDKPMQLGRMGADEFLLVMPSTDLAHARTTAKRVIDFMGVDDFVIGTLRLNITCSIGVTEPDVGTAFSEALIETESACKQAKLDPQRRIVAYGASELAYSVHKAEVATIKLLTSGSADIQGMYLEAQPIMALDNPHGSLNLELLLRMRDPNGLLVPTTRVIAAAKACARLAVVDRWVVATALAWLDDNRLSMPNLGFVSVNISDVSINDEGFVEDLLTLLESYHGTATQHLCIEISESILLLDSLATRDHLLRIRSLGVRLGIDDFGAGHTTLARLVDLPADFIKLDGNFVKKLSSNAENSAVVEALVALARGLQMKTIAKWTEESATIDTLRAKGMDYVQGYAVAAPVSLTEIVKYRSAGDFLTLRAPELP